MSLLNAVLLESKVEMTIVCLFPKAPNVSVTRKDCVVSCSAIELRSECEHARDKKNEYANNIFSFVQCSSPGFLLGLLPSPAPGNPFLLFPLVDCLCGEFQKSSRPERRPRRWCCSRSRQPAKSSPLRSHRWRPALQNLTPSSPLRQTVLKCPQICENVFRKTKEDACGPTY